MITGKELKSKVFIDAVNSANKLLIRDEFYRGWENKQFDKATCLGQRIADKIRESMGIDSDKVIHFTVKEYRSWRPNGVYAYVNISDPYTLYLNNRYEFRYKKGVKLTPQENLLSVRATCIHEKIHGVDGADTQHSYGHGDNSPKGKENCAPNWLGNHSQKFRDDNPDVISSPTPPTEIPDYNEKPNIKYKKTIWYYLKFLNPRNWV